MRSAMLVTIAGIVATLPVPASSLERASRMDVEDPESPWTATGSCTVFYYNYCTGWIWIRSDLAYRELGVVVEACCASGATLGTTWQYYYTSATCGYGYAGTISICAVDANACPVDPPLSEQPYCVGWLGQADWVACNWGIPVPSRFAVVVDTDHYRWAYTEFVADHPRQGPTGPPACGTCYPTTRVNHSFLFSDRGTPFCPPEPFFNDGTCDAELLWHCSLLCPVSTEPTNWARVKSLFR